MSKDTLIGFDCGSPDDSTSSCSCSGCLTSIGTVSAGGTTGGLVIPRCVKRRCHPGVARCMTVVLSAQRCFREPNSPCFRGSVEHKPHHPNMALA